MAGVDPHFENLEAWVSAGVRSSVPMAELHTVFDHAFSSVAAAAAGAGAVLVGPAYAEYFGMPTDVVDVEIGFGAVHAVDDLEVHVAERPAEAAAVGPHAGPYDALSGG